MVISLCTMVDHSRQHHDEATYGCLDMNLSST
jgi:hypothetical protein